MRDAPSPELVELLDRLGVSPRLRWRSVSAAARRIAGNLPLLDSVWLDALVRLRHLSPYQARELASGRGAQLVIGPHLARQRLPPLGYAEVLQADEHMLIRAKIDSARQEQVAEQLAQLSQKLQECTSLAVCRIDAHGVEGDTAWITMESLQAVQTTDWMVENGRFPPRVVMHIARQMLIGLCELERHGLAHGDIRTRTLFIDRTGQVRLAFAGLRDALQSGVGSDAFLLPPDCYDTLAPERACSTTPATVSSDLFSCGCLWWQLLTGRPAIPGGSSDAKRAFALAGKVPDVRKFAPDVPEVLAEMIAHCTQLNAADRPRSFGEMAATLGPPSEAGTKMIVDCLRRPERWVLPHPKSSLRRGKVAQLSLEVVAVSACLLAALVGWRLFGRANTAVIAKAPRTSVVAPGSLSESAPSNIEPPVESPIPQPPPATKVSFQAPIAESKHDRRGPEPLRLPEGRLVRLASLHLEDGQRVCGEHEGRVRVQTPPEGLLIDRADARFEKIDFVAHSDTHAAMLRLTASTASFVDCTFRGPENAETAQPAIRWEDAGQTDKWDATSDLLELTNCIFDRIAFAVERKRDLAASLEAHNVLQTRSAGFLRNITTEKNAALRIALENCTFRETGPVVCVDQSTTAAETHGRLIVSAIDSVFAIQPQSALVECRQDVPSDVEERIKWSGRDSLLSLDVPLVSIANSGEEAEPDSVDEAVLNVVGLGRSSLTFTEESFETPAASRLRRWVAARTSPHPPGIIEKRLPPGFGEPSPIANPKLAHAE